MMYQLITKRGVVITGEIYDLDSARLALDNYNDNRAWVQQYNRNRQVAWSRGYNAARDAVERALWNRRRPRKMRVPAEVILVGRAC